MLWCCVVERVNRGLGSFSVQNPLKINPKPLLKCGQNSETQRESFFEVP